MILQPQEIEVWYLIPAVRKELAKALVKRGINQKKTAEILGTTEACISQYIKSKRGNLKLPKEVINEIEKSAERLSKGACVIKEVQAICSYSKKTRFLCNLHKKYSNKILCGGACCCQ